MTSVAVSVRDARGAPADRLWIQSMYRDYLDDLNPGTGLFPRLGEVGHREPDQIVHWFADPNTYPLVIVRSTELVGFARVLRAALSPARQPRIDYRMAEFFIARPRRRLGVGQTAVQLILKSLCRSLGDQRVRAQCGSREFLAPRGLGVHGGALPGAHHER